MAIIKFGTTIVGVRGTIAGITFSANKAGPHAKGWTRGANPRTSRQATQRNRQSTWAAAWRALTAAQQAGWNTYAAAAPQQKFNSLGVAYFASGFSWYVALSMNLVAAGALPISTAPVLAQPTPPPITNIAIRISGIASTSRIRYAADVNLAMRKGIEIWMTNSQGRNVGPAKKVFMVNGTVDGVGNLGFQPQLEARFGTIVLGQRGFAATYNQNAEGRRSSYVYLSADTVAV